MLENISQEKVLITGGTGFLGRHLVNDLISREIKPIILTRQPRSAIFPNFQDSLTVAEIDLFDAGRLEDFMHTVRPSVVIHLAGYSRPPDSDLAFLDKFNFEATVKLLDLANAVRVKRFILTGTADEYGFQYCPQSETLPAKPVSEYAVSKNKAVNYALSLHKQNGFPAIVLRPFTVYGVGQPSSMFIAQAVECATGGRRFEMSKGAQKRDLLFVTDFADAIIETLTAENIEGEIFNVGSGHSTALKDVAEMIWEIAGADKNLLKIGARPTKDSELHDTQADITKIRACLNWYPKISAEEGLKIVVETAKRIWNERKISVGRTS